MISSLKTFMSIGLFSHETYRTDWSGELDFILTFSSIYLKNTSLCNSIKRYSEKN